MFGMSRIRSIQVAFVSLVAFVLLLEIKSTSKQVQQSDSECRRSRLESDDFICEPDHIWEERKRTFQFQDKENRITRKQVYFFYDNWGVNFQCSNARRIGSMGEGGKWVCDPFKLKSRRDCLIYSAGSNGEFSFEFAVKQLMPHCEIHTFDKDYHPYPKEICVFHEFTLGNDLSPVNVRNWTSILRELNHTRRTIDIFKIDIEGDEFSFLPLIFDADAFSLPRQILVEIHPKDDRTTNELFQRLQNLGYVIFAKEENVLAGPWFYEFAFLRLNRRFFSQS